MAVPPPSQDPFHLIRAEITTQYNDIQKKVHRFHLLATSNPERKELAAEVDRDCESVVVQVSMLREAVDTAAENPARFNLTMEEIQGRRKWLDTQTRQVNGIRDSIKTMTNSTPHLPTTADRAVAANDKYLASETQMQEQIIRQQDENLTDIERGVENVTNMGKQIHEHIKEDERLLTNLDNDMSTTYSRLRATTRKMQEIIKKSGSTSQLVIIIVLIVVVAVLAYFVFA